MPIHDWTRVSAGIFHDFHHEWISTIKRRLNLLLPQGYYALAEQIAGGREPDVLSLEHIHGRPSNGRNEREKEESLEQGGIAVATAPPKVRFTAEAELDRYAAKRKRIAIRHSSNDRVVGLIEIVSPGNKDRAASVQDFVEKAVQFLDAGIHLLIVDLFPPTPRDPEGMHHAIWSRIAKDDFTLPHDEPLTVVSYSAGPIKRAYIEPAAVGRALPEMPTFLQPETYVLLPLEQTYNSAFEAVPKRWQDELK